MVNSESDFNENSFEIFVEDPISGKTIKLRVEGQHSIKQIVDVITKHLGSLTTDERTYGLVLKGQELPPWITIEDAIHEFGLKEGDKFSMWAKVKAAALNLQALDNLNDDIIQDKRRKLINFLEQNARDENKKSAYILPFKFGIDNNFGFSVEIKNDKKIKAIEINNIDDINNYLENVMDSSDFLIKLEIKTYAGEMHPEFNIDKSQKDLIKEQILKQISDKDLDRLRSMTSENFDYVKSYFNEKSSFAKKYLKDNFFDTLLNYFVEYELFAKLWSQYYSQFSQTDTDLITKSYLQDRYLTNWYSNDVKTFQRLIWGVILDFRHPLTSQRFEYKNSRGDIVPDLNTWMSFALHHWKTGEGHENKFECFWAAIAPLPASESIGTPVHNDITNSVNEIGKIWEDTFETAISAILSGNVPNLPFIEGFTDKYSIGWNDQNANDDFKEYADSTREIRELIKLFLYSQISFN